MCAVTFVQHFGVISIADFMVILSKTRCKRRIPAQCFELICLTKASVLMLRYAPMRKNLERWFFKKSFMWVVVSQLE